MHTSTLSTFSAALLIASASLGDATKVARKGTAPGSPAVFRRQWTPNGANMTYVDEMLENHPNASGKWDTIGFDLTKPYGGNSSKQEGWEIALHVGADLPYGTTNLSHANPARIYLTAPDDAFGDDGDGGKNSSSGSSSSNSSAVLDKGWKVCTWTWIHELHEIETVEELRNSDPEAQCNKVLSAKCVKAMEDAAVDASCEGSIAVPEDCEDNIVSSGGTYNRGPDANLVNNTSGTYIPFTSYPPYNRPGNKTDTEQVYDYAVTSVWPILVAWRYEADGGGERRTFSDFRCLQAKDIAEGSRQPEGFGKRPKKSAAGAVAPSAALWSSAAVGAALASSFLL